MLKLVKMKDPSLKLNFLSEFHPNETAFICSDIKNKQFLESQLLEKYQVLPGNSVLRANEFYKILFTSLNKKWSLRSDAFVKQLLSQYLSTQKHTQHLIQSETFFKWFQFCLMFFLQDRCFSLFKEWLESSRSNLFPKKWLHLFEEFFKLLESKNILYESGIKAFLSNKLSSLNAISFEEKTLVVDLAFSMSFCEKNLFKELSRFKEVYVLSPVLKFNFLFENKGYDFYLEWEKELERKNIIHLKSQSLGDSAKELNRGRNEETYKDDRTCRNDEVVKPVSHFRENGNPKSKKPAGSFKEFNRCRNDSAYEDDNIYGSDGKEGSERPIGGDRESRESLFNGRDKRRLSKDERDHDDEELIRNEETLRNDRERGLEDSSSFSIPKSNPSFFKFESRTQNQAVQQAVQQVSQWLKQGVSPEDIAIYTPYIEEDWFILKYHLEKQSIPYKKTSYSSLIEFREIKYLLSVVRFYLNVFEFQDLETFYFYKDSKKDYNKIKQKHFEVLKQNKIEKPFLKDKQRDSKQLVSGFEFVEWVFSFWSSDLSKKTESALLKVLKKLLVKDQLSFQSWLLLLESEVLSQDIDLEKEKDFGISCLSFNAFHSVKSSYMILLGLNESAFKESSLVGEEALSSLLNDLGFSLDFKLPKEKEKSLLWFLQSSHFKEVYLNTYLYDRDGNIEGKALITLFLEQFLKPSESFKSTSFLVEQESFKRGFDQSNQIETIRQLLKAKGQKQLQAIEKAFTESPSRFFHPQLESLSVRQIKTYTDCPFKYAAEKIFHIKDQKALQQELSPLIKGVTAHKLFKMILESYPDLQPSTKQKEDLIESLLPDEDYFAHKEEQIFLLKEYLNQLIESFLFKEEQQRKNHPSLKPLAFEARLKAFWNQKTGQLDSKGDYLFKGSIDRIDQEEVDQTYVLRDYKASLSQRTHISSWLKKDEIQLLFYAQTLQKGLVEGLAPSKVSALFYSAYNEDFKSKGFLEEESHLDQVEENLIDGSQSSYTKTEKELLAMINSMNKKVQDLVSQIEKGEFFPQPKDKTVCQSCSYKRLCRMGYV